jgi:hypothetical protein
MTDETSSDVPEGSELSEPKAAPAEKAKPRAKRFDPSKPHGTVHGTSKAAFFQDGVYYDASGKKVGNSL